ncbi:MAG: hypothetical protein B7X60_01070 [Polynucleobacter sp. 39-45-136]|nr:MAG: hypothetical protein B7X60_01070 [Polynucleobacter sp. 39-45-136]
MPMALVCLGSMDLLIDLGELNGFGADLIMGLGAGNRAGCEGALGHFGVAFGFRLLILGFEPLKSLRYLIFSSRLRISQIFIAIIPFHIFS